MELSHMNSVDFSWIRQKVLLKFLTLGQCNFPWKLHSRPNKRLRFLRLKRAPTLDLNNMLKTSSRPRQFMKRSFWKQCASCRENLHLFLSLNHSKVFSNKLADSIFNKPERHQSAPTWRLKCPKVQSVKEFFRKIVNSESQKTQLATLWA